MELACAASCTASLEKNWPAVLPYTPNVSTTSGTQFQPRLEQMGSLHLCFLSAVCLAAAPATIPASDKILDISIEVIKTSMTAGLLPVTSLELVCLQAL